MDYKPNENTLTEFLNDSYNLYLKNYNGQKDNIKAVKVEVKEVDDREYNSSKNLNKAKKAMRMPKESTVKPETQRSNTLPRESSEKATADKIRPLIKVVLNPADLGLHRAEEDPEYQQWYQDEVARVEARVTVGLDSYEIGTLKVYREDDFTHDNDQLIELLRSYYSDMEQGNIPPTEDFNSIIMFIGYNENEKEYIDTFKRIVDRGFFELTPGYEAQNGETVLPKKVQSIFLHLVESLHFIKFANADNLIPKNYTKVREAGSTEHFVWSVQYHNYRSNNILTLPTENILLEDSSKESSAYNNLLITQTLS